jgi:transposase-like protein
MLDSNRLSGHTDCINLDFLEREATPEPAIKLGIQLHLAGLSLSDTILILEKVGVERHRTTVHTWVQKANLQPAGGASPNQVAVDETVIQLNDEPFWLYAAVDPAINRILYVKLSPTKNSATSSMFLAELREKHCVDNAVFLVDSAPWLHAALHHHSLRFL